MRSSTGSKRRETTRVTRASARFVPESEVPALMLNESARVRSARVAEAKERIASVGYDLDTNFRNALHKLLEDFGA